MIFSLLALFGCVILESSLHMHPRNMVFDVIVTFALVPIYLGI